MKTSEIKAIAEVAAQAAYDGPGEACSPESAYQFIRQMAYEEFDGDDESAKAEWDRMALSPLGFTLFREHYFESLSAILRRR